MRIFTILLMSVCALVSSSGAMAADLLSTLIGDNKVWNYHSDIYSMDKLVNSYDSYSLHCKGTVEKNGMTYSIVSLRNENEEIAYIREEDGKLFISSDSPVFRRGVSGKGSGYIDPEFEDIQEFPVFDFNAKEGETFQGLVNHIYGYRIGEVEVKRSETKNVNGRELRILTVTLKSIRESVDDKYVDIVGEETVVEGIGYLKEWFFLP